MSSAALKEAAKAKKLAAEQEARTSAASSRADAAEARRAKMAEMEEQRRVMLKSVMTHEALERLSTVAMVKPDIARQIEDIVC